MSTDQIDKWQVPDLNSAIPAPSNQQNNLLEHQKGFEQGYQEGLNKANQEIAQKCQAIEQVVAQLQNLNTLIDETTINVVETYCKQVVEQVILGELTTQADVLKRLVEEALKSLQTKSMVVIELNPELHNTHLKNIEVEFKEKGIELKANPNCQFTQLNIIGQEVSLTTDLLNLGSQLLNPQSVPTDD